MKGIIDWAVKNGQAMNVIVIGVLLIGAWSVTQLRRDFWPDYEVYSLEISVRYPGATPDEVEDGIVERIEQAIYGIDGIDELTASAREGVGSLRLELISDADESEAQRILGEVKTAIDQIPSFPDTAEEPNVRLRTGYTTAIRVAVVGPDDRSMEAALRLRRVAERIRNEVLALPSVSIADFSGAPEFQIDIEIPEQTLRQYGLTLRQVAQQVRDNNLELPGGTLKGRSQEILLRGSNKREWGEEIRQIPLVTDLGGAVLSVDDLGEVKDDFADGALINEINGRPAVVMSVETTNKDDLIRVSDEVINYVEGGSDALPEGYDMVHMRDRSTSVRGRLDLLAKNGWMGLILVFIVLTLFLEMRLAVWVALGIPVSLLGACIFMYYTGETLNMSSMFAFLIALGIVVDDAIVVGENIYAHREMGKSYRQAAVDGAFEVMPSVFTAVITTVIAFMPIMYMEGRIKKLTVVLPICVSAMLLISLVESLTILPAHLSHRRSRFMDVVEYLLFPLRPIGWLLGKANKWVTGMLDQFVERWYLPSLKSALRNPIIVVSVAAGLLVLSIGVVRAGVVPFSLFPKIDFGFITSEVVFPDGTPIDVTDKATKRLEEAIWRVNQHTIREGLTDNPEGVVKIVQRSAGASADISRGGGTAGSHVGGILVQLIPLRERDISSEQIVQLWRKETGRIDGAEYVAFGASPRGPAALPIEMRLSASSEYLGQLEDAIQACKEKLAEYPYVKDIGTDTRLGKWEYRMQVRERSKAMGISLAELSRTVRATYYGEEVMRLQRGRYEVQLRVRYPQKDRESIARFENIRIRGNDGMERPLGEIASVDVDRGYAEVSRVDQKRSIGVVADVDEQSGNAFNVVADLQANFEPEFRSKFPNVELTWKGQQEQTTESVNSLTVGFVVVLGAMFLLLTLQFGSWSNALLILVIIPFGFIGAIFGHIVMGFDLTLFSIFGIVALAGVVVNDSIVLVDFINRRRADGMSLDAALIDAGRRRFRAVLLTSLTTIAGMLPIMLERSRQAQVVAPMATSLTFGLALTTVLVLILTPVMYWLTAKVTFEESVVTNDVETNTA